MVSQVLFHFYTLLTDNKLHRESRLSCVPLQSQVINCPLFRMLQGLNCSQYGSHFSHILLPLLARSIFRHPWSPHTCLGPPPWTHIKGLPPVLFVVSSPITPAHNPLTNYSVPKQSTAEGETLSHYLTYWLSVQWASSSLYVGFKASWDTVLVGGTKSSTMSVRETFPCLSSLRSSGYKEQWWGFAHVPSCLVLSEF